MIRAVAVVSVCMLAWCGAAACSGDGDRGEEGQGTGSAPTTVAPADTTVAPTTSTPAAQLAGVTVTLTEVTTVDQPTGLAVRSGDPSLYVIERPGRVRRIEVAAPTQAGRPPTYRLDRTPVLDISDEVEDGGQEQGLLGIAFAPDGRRLFLAWTDNDGQQRLEAFEMGESRADADSGRTVLVVPDERANHNGGQLAFGPDGFLWWGMGDGGGGGDPLGTGQDPSDLLGSILRIDPDGGDPYGVPASNPFVTGGGAPEVWAYGLRNPWRFSFDTATGDLWIADVGQGDVEEIDFLPAATGRGHGANLGWNEMEGDEPYRGGSPPDNHVPPIFTYRHDEGCSVTGGFVYRGLAIPALAGAYLFGDYCAGALRAVVQQDGSVVEEADLGATVPSLSSFGQDAAGELYALSLEGSIYRLDP